MPHRPSAVLDITAETRDQTVARLNAEQAEYVRALHTLDAQIVELNRQRALYSVRLTEVDQQLTTLLDDEE